MFLGLEAREHPAALVCDAETRVGAALRRLLAENIDIDQAAELSGLTVREVRRLIRDRGKPTSAAVRGAGEPAPALTRDGQPVDTGRPRSVPWVRLGHTGSSRDTPDNPTSLLAAVSGELGPDQECPRTGQLQAAMRASLDEAMRLLALAVERKYLSLLGSHPPQQGGRCHVRSTNACIWWTHGASPVRLRAAN